jgi:hypothetical protein
MSKYFDKAFFKFFFGFLAILAISFILLVVTNYFEGKSTQVPDNASPLQSMAVHSTSKIRVQ